MTYCLEETYATAPSSTYTAIQVVRDPDIAPLVVDRQPRETVRPWHGNDLNRLINRRVTMAFDVYLTGSGTAGTAPAYGGLLTTCANTEAVVGASPGPASVTYTMSALNGTIPSATMRWHQDGMRHQVTGFRGTWTASMPVGEFPRIRLEGTGIYSRPTDTALPTATFSNQAAPFDISAGNTPTVNINSVGQCMASFELSLGNDVQFETYAGCVEKIAIRDRQPTGTIEIESKLIAGQNFWSLFEAATLVPFSIIHNGGGAGNTVTLTIANAQLLEPLLTDRNGVQFMQIPFNPITTDGTSEISLAFT